MTGDVLACLEYFLHGDSCSNANVEVAFEVAFERVHNCNVRIDEIHDMDVVTDARAIGRRVVVAVDDELLSLARSNLKTDGNEMRFGPVVFTDASLWIGARDVEVPERCV